MNDNTPISFGEALIANNDAMDRYLRLPRRRQEEILNNSANISSTDEMRAYIERIIDFGATEKGFE